MKRFYLFVLLAFVSLPVLAKNKISMVTYFPVPYVAYSQVNADEQMDIGLTSTCSMKLGCEESPVTLNAAQVNLTGGRLNLNGGRGILGDTLTLGSGRNVGQISFQSVRIQKGNTESVNSDKMTVSALELFGKAFPSCRDKDASGQMQWASLKLKGASSKELYLTCGKAQESVCCSADDLSKGKVCNTSTNTCVCPEGKTENSTGYCVDSCTPSANYTKVFGRDIKSEMAYYICEAGWEGKTSPYRCRSGQPKTCKDAYRTSTRKGVFHKDYYRGTEIMGASEYAADCGGSGGFNIAKWSSSYPPVKITKWVDFVKTNSGSSVSSVSTAENMAARFCETSLPSYSAYTNGIYGLYYCAPQGSPLSGYRTHVFGYCEVDYEYMYAEVTCC